METIRLALVGCGSHGMSLGRRFAGIPGVRVTVTPDTDFDRAEAAARELGARPEYDPVSACASADADAVVIATPNFTHRALAEAAVSEGKHVFCEKPMALSVEDCDAMIAASHRAGVRLMVGHMQRLFPLLAEVRHSVHSGALGEPVAVSVTRRDYLVRPPGWLREREKVGGVLFQSSVHEIDWLRSVFGDVARVYAQAAPQHIQTYLDFPDTVFLTLGFSDGTLGALQACMSDHVEAYSGQINGTEASLHFDLHRGEITLGRDPDDRRTITVPDGSLSTAYGPAGTEIVESFVGWLREDVPPPVTAWDGRQAVAVACAAERSLETGRPEQVESELA